MASAVKRVSLGTVGAHERTPHLLGLRGQQCSGAGKGKQAKEKLGQRLRAKGWGRETAGSNQFRHTEEGSRDEAGETGQGRIPGASQPDSADCSWLPYTWLCDVTEAVFSWKPRTAISSLPTSQRG